MFIHAEGVWRMARFVQLLKPKFLLPSAVNGAPRHVLDVGVANSSYQELRAVFPDARYDGVDHVETAVVFGSGDQFILCDLDSFPDLELIEPKYDLIIVNHVLEHLTHGHRVFSHLCKSLVPGGVLYAEFPSIRTAMTRKTRNTYHFHDDPTHKAFYRLEDLANIAMREHCKVASCGPVSTPLKDVLSLPRALIGWMLGKGWGPYLLHFQRKIDHIMIVRPNPPRA